MKIWVLFFLIQSSRLKTQGSLLKKHFLKPHIHTDHERARGRVNAAVNAVAATPDLWVKSFVGREGEQVVARNIKTQAFQPGFGGHFERHGVAELDGFDAEKSPIFEEKVGAAAEILVQVRRREPREIVARAFARPTVERIGGGSARCMMAEVFLNHTSPSVRESL